MTSKISSTKISSKLSRRGFVVCPRRPGMICERILAIGRQELQKLSTLVLRKAGADTHMLQRSRFIKESKQKRADRFAFSVLVPAKAGNDAVAVALMLDLEHDPLAGFIGTVQRLYYHSVESGAFKTAKPIGCDCSIARCWR